MNRQNNQGVEPKEREGTKNIILKRIHCKLKKILEIGRQMLNAHLLNNLRR